MPKKQWQIDKESGHADTFWKNVDTEWIWTGQKNTNHNGKDCKKYEYGVFELCSRETSNFAKPTCVHKSKLAHRVCLFLTFGVELSRDYEVFPFNGNHLDINPKNLGIRDIKSRQEWPAEDFCSALVQEAAE